MEVLLNLPSPIAVGIKASLQLWEMYKVATLDSMCTSLVQQFLGIVL